MQEKKQLENLYEQKLRDRMKQGESAKAGPVFKLVKVERSTGNFLIQCCIR